MKNCKRRTIFSWIFALILLIPMFSIAIRSLYVIFNKNAYQSYANEIQSTVLIGNSNESLIQSGQTYFFEGMKQPLTNSNGWNTSGWGFTFTNATTDLQTFFNVSYPVDGLGYGSDANYNNYYRVNLHNANTQSWVQLSDLHYYNDPFSQRMKSLNFTFTLNAGTDFYKVNNINYLVYSKPNLDNVFEYSVQQFVDKHGNGLINFFGLLDHYFMETTTANTLYFTFANWCFNYVLLVSCVWLLFSVLMWFINYCNYMLNTSFRKGHGD